MAARNASASAPGAGRDHQRQHQPARGRDFLVAARQPGQIGMRAGRRLRHRDLAALHRGVGPGHAAAREHRDRDVLRRRIAGDADVEALRANLRDRHHADPQASDRGPPSPRSRSRRAPGAPAPRPSAGTAKLAPSPPNTKGNSRSCERVGHRDDHRGAGHVHRLVAVLGDRLGRLHHVGDADHPVAGQRPEQARVHHLGEVAKQRQLVVEVVGRCGVHALQRRRLRAAPGSWPLPDRDRAPAAAAIRR